MVERKRHGRAPKREYGYDMALIKAKRDKTLVDLVLAADFATPSDGLLSADDTIAAMVCHVDTYAVEFELMGGGLDAVKDRGKKVWINKAFIAGVWIR
jgi:hypothetical protein